MWESGVSPLDHEIVSGPGDHVGTRRSYLDPEVIWEPGGSSLDPDILFGTRRLSTDPEVVWEPGGRFEPGGFSGPGGRLGTQRFLQDPEVVLNPKVSFGPEGRFEPGGFSRPGGRFESEGCSGPGGLEMFSGPGDCMGTRRKSLTGLEGVMTQVPGFAAFHVWKSRIDLQTCFNGHVFGLSEDDHMDVVILRILMAWKWIIRKNHHDETLPPWWGLVGVGQKFDGEAGNVCIKGDASAHTPDACASPDPRILRGRIFARLRIKGMRRFNKTRRPKLGILMFVSTSRACAS
ncbi:hypothetical protein F2Q70_00036197 [Brassica cretica]|uniref:Uncharacterized protein n=1 Tax=Brassica cretica TaxID=69181 RepID=A0A8S9JXG4_BRACR|nr:hypothetical protein F2Q70_00036197 [Brassica cretica]